MAKDPVCGMMVDEKKTNFKSDFANQRLTRAQINS